MKHGARPLQLYSLFALVEGQRERNELDEEEEEGGRGEQEEEIDEEGEEVGEEVRRSERGEDGARGEGERETRIIVATTML